MRVQLEVGAGVKGDGVVVEWGNVWTSDAERGTVRAANVARVLELLPADVRAAVLDVCASVVVTAGVRAVPGSDV